MSKVTITLNNLTEIQSAFGLKNVLLSLFRIEERNFFETAEFVAYTGIVCLLHPKRCIVLRRHVAGVEENAVKWFRSIN